MSEWTVDTLKEHLADLRADDQRALAAALASAEKANDKAETAQRAVNKTQNEFRGTLKDQASTLMPIKEAEAKFEDLQKQITDLSNSQKTSTGRTEGSQITMGKMVTLVTVVTAILGTIVIVANAAFG